MKIWSKALIAAVVSEAISLGMWITGIKSVAGEPVISLTGALGGFLHYPGFPVEAWARRHHFGDTMIPVIGVPLLCWFILWMGVLSLWMKRHRKA